MPSGASLSGPVGTGYIGWETMQLSLALGANGQPFNLTLDYSESMTMVFAVNYNQTRCNSPSPRRNTFDKKASLSFREIGGWDAERLAVPFADIAGCGGLSETGYNNATFVADTLMVGSTLVPNITFRLVHHAQRLNPLWASDGVFGLGVDAFCVVRHAMNCTIYGLLDVFDDPLVALYLTGFQLGGYTTAGRLKTSSAVLIPYAAFIWAPPKVHEIIVRIVGAEYSFKYDEYVVECSKVQAGLPDMIFELDGYTQVVPAKLYTRQLPNDQKTCVLLVRDNSDPNVAGVPRDDWVFGTAFLRASCHAFDYKNFRVGFANLLHQ